MRYVFGDYILDTQRRELRCRGHAVPVRPKVFDLLVYLIMHHDRAVSKQALLTHLWPNLHVSLTSLSDCIRLARQAVGDSGATQHVIQTLHGRGYRFVAPVEAQEQVPPANQPQPGLPPAEPVLVLAPTPAHAAAAADTSSIVRHTANGEYKPVTVLCCGIADALLLAARLGSEAMYRLMQAVFGLVQEVMRHYEGTMTHHTSESFTAVFGVPVAQEDHARWAVLAAFELHQRLRTDPALHAHTSGEVSSSARDSTRDW
jgi:DNA-binding winged helix-turn-helix (wHTH) protein